MAMYPKSLQLIADYCGEEVMFAVWKSYSGVHLCIPSKITPDHSIAQKITFEYAQILVKQLGGESIGYIAKYECTNKSSRNKLVIEQAQMGWSQAKIALQHNLSEKQVANVIKKCVLPPQEDLFNK